MEGVIADSTIPGLEKVARGRSRDLYALDDQLLSLATDRVCFEGRPFPDGVPDQGRVINQLSAFWFDFLQNAAPSHFISADLEQIDELLRSAGVDADADQLRSRVMLVNRARPYPIRVHVYSYLVDAAWREYSETGALAGQSLPAGLGGGDSLPQPLLLPLAQDGDGETRRLEWEQMVHQVEPGHLNQMFAYARAIYEAAAAHALQRGIILTATELRFGLFQGMTILIGDCLTPDRTRYWDAEGHQPGRKPREMGAQYPSDAAQWTGGDHAHPRLTPEILARTGAVYRELFYRLTGAELE